jgi:hypothetical protein
VERTVTDKWAKAAMGGDETEILMLFRRLPPAKQAEALRCAEELSRRRPR